MNVIVTSYFNYANDPQRGDKWDNRAISLTPLIESCKNSEVVIFHNGADIPFYDHVIDVEVPPSEHHSPINYRWTLYKDFLKYAKCDNVFFVDATDVIMLREPWNYIKPDKIYIGDERGHTCNSKWMQKYIHPTMPDDFSRYYDKPLLNAGIVGGSYSMMRSFVQMMAKSIEANPIGLLDHNDMGWLNYTAYKHFEGNIVHGSPVNTIFKQFKDNGEAWFQHK